MDGASGMTGSDERVFVDGNVCGGACVRVCLTDVYMSRSMIQFFNNFFILDMCAVGAALRIKCL